MSRGSLQIAGNLFVSSHGWAYTAVKSQKAVSAYFTSKQILPFGFAEQFRGQVNQQDAAEHLFQDMILNSITFMTDSTLTMIGFRLRSSLPWWKKCVCVSEMLYGGSSRYSILSPIMSRNNIVRRLFK